jgi:hypothetical protein
MSTEPRATNKTANVRPRPMSATRNHQNERMGPGPAIHLFYPAERVPAARRYPERPTGPRR